MKNLVVCILLVFFLVACTAPQPTNERPGATLTGRDLPPAGHVVRAGWDQPPVPIMMKNPIYSAALQKKKITGVVVVEFTIGPDGKVSEAHAISSPDPALSQAAVDAIMQSVFQPGLKDGKPKSVRTQTAVTFELKKQEPIQQPQHQRP